MSFGAPYPSPKPPPKGGWQQRPTKKPDLKPDSKQGTSAPKKHGLRNGLAAGLALVVIGGGAFLGYRMLSNSKTAATTAPGGLQTTKKGNDPTLTAPVTVLAPTKQTSDEPAGVVPTTLAIAAAVPADFVPKPAPGAPAGAPNPLFGPNYNPTDGKPTYVCGTEADSAYTLIQMQMTGKDLAHGFHLGIVPLQFGDGPYKMSEETHVKLMVDGVWDCMVERVDENAELNMGVVTTIVDESAGSDGIWARGDLKTYDDLKGKRVGFVDKTSSRFFLLYVLNIMSPEDRKTVQVQAFDTIDDAIAGFNEGKLDAVSGFEPYLSQTAAKGGKPLLTTEQLRVIVHSILTSRNALAKKSDLVQAFHDAWFDTLKDQIEHTDAVAAQVASWGYNDWTTIKKDSAADALRVRLKERAQATLQQNAILAADDSPIMNIMQNSRNFFLAEMEENKEAVPTDMPTLESQVDFDFVKRAAAKAELQASGKPLNSSFSLRGSAPTPAANLVATKVAAVVITPTVAPTAALVQAVVTATAQPAVVGVTPTVDVSATLAVLPCRRFAFLPNSAQLTQESIRVLNVCVLPTLQQRAGLFLNVKGSAAWPGPAGTFTKDQISGFGKARAKAIVDYLISQKVDPARLLIDGVMPPTDHWETLDAAKQAEDRFVEMTLVTTGW